MAARRLDLDDLSSPHVLREYALLADGERGILVGPRGDFAWMCFPSWESEALFAALIGGRGVYALTPRGRYVWGGYYEDGTLIWRSRWTTTDSIMECREALVVPASRHRAVVLRRLIAVEGEARADVVLDGRAGFGQQPMTAVERVGDRVWTARTGTTYLRWSGADDVEVAADGHGGRALATTLDLEPGCHRDLVLEVGEHAPDGAPEVPERLWVSTEDWWAAARSATPATDVAGRDVRHAYAVLRGMTSTSGGMVAAATTSLPERAGEGRSYDYRYAWIRDQCLAGQAMAAAGPHPLVDGAAGFVTDRLLDDEWRLRPAYTVSGEHIPGETALGLSGYPGGSDIVGNRVSGQFQLDTFGQSLLLLAAAARHDRLDARGWRAADVACSAIARRWQEPDAGIWELEPAIWTESRLTCVAGLRAIVAAGAPPSRARDWSCLADVILDDTLADAVHPNGRWQRTPDDVRVDAALLLPMIRGAVPPSDPHALATMMSVREELVQDGFVFRFAPDDRPLGEAEGAFVMCGYLMSLACLRIGDHLSAARFFECNRAACGPPGLFTEEYDVGERQLRGNIPQAFAHGLMVECAVRQGAGGWS